MSGGTPTGHATGSRPTGRGRGGNTTPTSATPAAGTLPAGQTSCGTRHVAAGGEGEHGRGRERDGTPRPAAPAPHNSPAGHMECGHHQVAAGGGQPPGRGQGWDGTPVPHTPAGGNGTPTSHGDNDTHVTLAGGGPVLLDPMLALLAETLEDFEGARIQTGNRREVLTRTEPDADGVMRGFGLTAEQAAPYAAIADEMARLEKMAVRELERQMRRHPLGPWVASQKGLGEKQVARLLAKIGDPYWNTRDGGPRTVSQLWSYCGFSTVPAGTGGARVAPTRQRGGQCNWSTGARMRCYNIAVSIMKQKGSPYRPVYDAARAKYADAVHAVPCVRCGPKGHPAPAGSPLSEGHKHGRALRAVSKKMLKELWRASRDIHLAREVGGGGT